MNESTSIKLFKQDDLTQTSKTIRAPGSKSEAIRYIIGAFLCQGISKLHNVTLCDDVLRTIYAIEAMGALVKITDNKNFVNLEIKGVGSEIRNKKSDFDKVTINVGSSATLFRLLVPIALMKYREVIVYANHDFWERPIDEYYQFMDYNGFEDYCILKRFDISSSLEVDGSISSQFASGLLFAQSLLGCDCALYVLNLESKKYVDMTVEVLKDFGIKIEKIANKYCIKKSTYQCLETIIKGDYSQASFFLTLGSKMKSLKILNLYKSLQADEEILYILAKMKADIKRIEDGYEIKQSDFDIDFSIDVSECIDLAPIIFCISATVAKDKNKEIKITGTRRLMYKESSRANSIETEFKKLGIKMDVNNNDCIIYPTLSFKNNIVLDSHHDHRICMALTIFALINNLECEVKNIESVKKSFPSFFEMLRELDIKFEKVN